MDAGSLVGILASTGGAICVALFSVALALSSALFSAGVVFSFAYSMAKDKRELLASGTPATATVVSAVHTDSYLFTPIFSITLSFVLPSGATRVAHLRRSLSPEQIQILQPGHLVDVRYDPANPSRVVLAGL